MEPVGLKQRIIFFINKIRVAVIIILINHLAICTPLYSFVEHKKYLDAMWWTSVTSFTVGYGDMYPATQAGRAVGQYTMFSMWFLFALLLALLIDAVRLNRDRFSHEEQEELLGDMDDVDTKTDSIKEGVDSLTRRLEAAGVIPPLEAP